MRYAFIAAERASFPVRRLCRLIGVAASAFYAWLRREPNRRAQDEAVLVAEIREIFEQSGGTMAVRVSTPSCGPGGAASAESGSLGSCASKGWSCHGRNAGCR